MPCPARIGLIVVLLVGICVSRARAQQRPRADTVDAWHEDAWTTIVEETGLKISYIYYPEADNENNGVVLRLENEGETPLRYVFTLVFRAPEADTSTIVRGELQPGKVKTGSASGLFWIPFEGTGYEIAEIGLRGLEVRPEPDL